MDQAFVKQEHESMVFQAEKKCLRGNFMLILQFTTAPKEAYKAFRNRLEVINNSPNANVYEVIKPAQM